MQSSECLAYFLDAEDLCDVFVGWPREIDLALCLDDSGRCELVVFHRDESSTILLRVSEVLGRDFGSFCVTPEVEGHPTRRVLFSEEQDMMSLIRSAPRLTEIAEDYLINYRFAVEEGLDTDLLTTGARRAEATAAQGDAPVEGDAAGAPSVPEAPADRVTSAAQFPERAAVEVQKGHIYLTLNDGVPLSDHLEIAPAALTVSGDGSGFLIEDGALAAWDRTGGALLDLPASAFPGPLAGQLRGARHARIDRADDGIVVTPLSQTPRTTRLGAMLQAATPMRLAVSGLVAVGLISGSVVTAYQAAGPTADLSGTRAQQVAAASDVALELIGTFAHAKERD